MYHFHFVESSAYYQLSKCNVIAFTLHLRGGVKDIRVNESRVVLYLPILGFGVSYVLYILPFGPLSQYTVSSFSPSSSIS